MKVIVVLFLTYFLYADQVVFRDGRQSQGVVEVRYYDRIRFFSESGTKYILLKLIQDIHYDRDEENLFFKGETFLKQGYLDKALDCFRLLLQKKWNVDLVQKRMERIYQKKRDLRNVKGREYVRAHQLNRLQDEQKTEKDIFHQWGLRLKKDKRGFKILSVFQNSWAYKQNLLTSDYLTEINGMDLKTMTYETVLKEVAQSEGEIVLGVEKDLILWLKKDGFFGKKHVNDMRYKGEKGAYFIMALGNFSKKSGLRKGDQLLKVGGQSTDFLLSDHIDQLIEDKKRKKISITVKRKFLKRL